MSVIPLSTNTLFGNSSVFEVGVYMNVITLEEVELPPDPEIFCMNSA